MGDFAELVQPHAPNLWGDNTTRAVLEIDRKLDLGPYEDVGGLERSVLAFPPEVVRGVWTQLLKAPPDELTAISEALLHAITAPLLALHGAKPPADYPTRSSMSLDDDLRPSRVSRWRSRLKIR